MKKLLCIILAAFLIFNCAPGHAIKTGKVQVYNLKADTFVRIYSTTLATATTSLTITGLDGNTDMEWLLKCKFINGYNGGSSYVMTLNGDSGTNYGKQFLYGNNTTVDAARTTTDGGVTIQTLSSLNEAGITEVTIYAKNGHARSILHSYMRGGSGTTPGIILLCGNSWNNTTDNITSLVITSDQTNGLGIGTTIELYARKASS